MASQAQVKAGLEVIRAIADAIREVKQVPAGHLYAAVMGTLSLSAFTRIVDMLVRSGLVRKQGDLLIWAELESVQVETVDCKVA